MFSKTHYKCSFCGKSQSQVRKLIAGPDVYICDSCIELCNEIILEELEDDLPVEKGIAKVLKPKEINERLTKCCQSFFNSNQFHQKTKSKGWKCS